MAKERRQRRHFTTEFKRKVVELVRSSGKPVRQIAQEHRRFSGGSGLHAHLFPSEHDLATSSLDFRMSTGVPVPSRWRYPATGAPSARQGTRPD
jgi:hypothetical protein